MSSKSNALAVALVLALVMGIVASIVALPAVAMLPIMAAFGALAGTTQACQDPSAVQVATTATVQAWGQWDAQQMGHAAIIITVGSQMGLSRRDQTIAVMTAIGESSLQNLDHGDDAGPDSRGLFQQRDSWGTLAQRMDPADAARLFFDELVTISGREQMEPTLVAHKVQRNADPNHYAKFWADAEGIVAHLSATSSTEASVGIPDVPEANRYNLGPVKPWVQTAAEVVGAKFNVAEVGGWRATSKVQGSDHPDGLALDFMVPVSDAGKQLGDQIALFVQTNAEALGVTYVIWYQQIWSVERSAEGWRDMEDRGDDSANHIDHVHVSFASQPGVGKLVDTSSDDPQAALCAELAALFGTGIGSSSSASADSAGSSVTGGVVLPVPSPGRITSPYGMRVHPVTGVRKLHTGTDFGASCGTPIYAVADGVVDSAGPASGYGSLIIIDHGDVQTGYAHMPNTSPGIRVKPGTRVLAGQQIGEVGSTGYSTGCHLHFEVRDGDDFIDPEIWLTGKGVDLD